MDIRTVGSVRGVQAFGLLPQVGHPVVVAVAAGSNAPGVIFGKTSHVFFC
jgi:hypothetical protein